MSVAHTLATLETTHVQCPSGAHVFCYFRRGGRTAEQLPILVLLHGYPQNSLMYKHFIGEAPAQWRLLIPDLPGYGQSTKPIAEDSRAHSKREWARDIMHCTDELFDDNTKIIPFGHDRGGRLAYRLAIDYRSRVAGVAVLDIVPTAFVWANMRIENDHSETKRSHHWITLAAPRPLPETMIAANARFYFDYTFTSWTKAPAETEWIRDGVNAYLDPEKGLERIKAACEDYRAGSTFDIKDDRESGVHPLAKVTAHSEQPFKCPILVLSSQHLRRRFDVDKIWKDLGPSGEVDSFEVGDSSTGHFIVNECPDECGQRLRNWLRRWDSVAAPA